MTKLLHLLVELGLSGEKEQFEAFYNEFYIALYNFVFKMVRSQECALDLTQEAFARLIASWDKADGKMGRKNYLFTIAANLCRDRARSAQRTSCLSMEIFPEFSDSGMESSLSMERRVELDHFEEILAALVDTLPERERMVLFMKKLDGMTYEDISKTTGIPLRTLKRTVRKSLDHIVQELEKHGVVEEGGLV